MKISLPSGHYISNLKLISHSNAECSYKADMVHGKGVNVVMNAPPSPNRRYVCHKHEALNESRDIVAALNEGVDTVLEFETKDWDTEFNRMENYNG